MLLDSFSVKSLREKTELSDSVYRKIVFNLLFGYELEDIIIAIYTIKRIRLINRII